MLVEIHRSTVAPSDVDRVLALRPRAVAELCAAVDALVRYDSARVDATTWLDIVIWRDADAAATAGAAAASLPLAGELHGLIASSELVGRGALDFSAPHTAR